MPRRTNYRYHTRPWKSYQTQMNVTWTVTFRGEESGCSFRPRLDWFRNEFANSRRSTRFKRRAFIFPDELYYQTESNVWPVRNDSRPKRSTDDGDRKTRMTFDISTRDAEKCPQMCDQRVFITVKTLMEIRVR